MADVFERPASDLWAFDAREPPASRPPQPIDLQPW